MGMDENQERVLSFECFSCIYSAYYLYDHNYESNDESFFLHLSFTKDGLITFICKNELTNQNYG